MIIICHIENDDINQMKSNQVMSIFITQSAKMVLQRYHLQHDDCCQFRNIEIQKYSNYAIRYIGTGATDLYSQNMELSIERKDDWSSTGDPGKHN